MSRVKSLLGIMALVGSVAAFGQGYLPYCTAASDAGAQFWTWTASTIDQACQTAESKLEGAGYRVTSVEDGYYNTDGENYGTLECIGYTEPVSGYGAQIFVEARNYFHENGLGGCILVLDSND